MKASSMTNLEWNPTRADFKLSKDAILSEGAFQRILILERKRSERSGDPFVLVHLDVRALCGETGQLDPVLRDSVFSLLLCTFRETDIIGWYQEDKAAAVILTELGEVTRDRVRAVVGNKVRHCLDCRLPGEYASRILTSVHYFPEDNLGELTTEVRDVLYPDLGSGRAARKSAAILKRVLDVAGSLALLLVLLPVFLVIAALVKWTSRGTVFFRQERMGQYGRTFQFLKFRSMYTNADSSIHEAYIQDFIKNGKSTSSDADGRPVFKIVQDSRVTPIGRLLRKASLDELPQFLNVLKGEMSLVGPRPPIPYELRQYDIWHRRRILEVKPGITGLWQVHGRSRTTFDEMVRMDLHYARNWSLGMDLKLLLLTPLAVFRGDGAV